MEKNRVLNHSPILQVTWLVVTEVRSECVGLVTERHHYNARPICANCSAARPVVFFIECGIARFLGACAYSTFEPHPCAKFRFCRAPPIAELARREKSDTQSLTLQLIWYTGNRSFRFGIMDRNCKHSLCGSCRQLQYRTFRYPTNVHNIIEVSRARRLISHPP